jgi:hypothetical protein
MAPAVIEMGVTVAVLVATAWTLRPEAVTLAPSATKARVAPPATASGSSAVPVIAPALTCRSRALAVFTELATGPTSVVTLTTAFEPIDAEVWSEVLAVGLAALTVIAPAPTSTDSAVGVLDEVAEMFRVLAVTWLFTAAEVSPGLPPIVSVPILSAEVVAPPRSVSLYIPWPLTIPSDPTTLMTLSSLLLLASTRTLPGAVIWAPESVCAIVWAWTTWMVPAAATDARPARLSVPANELRSSVESARTSTLLLELTTAPVPI